MEIRLYREDDWAGFRGMLARYYREDAGLSLTGTAADELAEELLSELGPLCWLWIAEEKGRAAGFLLAQIDTPESLWNYRSGEGFIRDMAVEPSFRGQGAGRALALAAEARFRSAGVSRVYLTAEDPTGAFWTRLGYAPSGEICRRNRLPVYEKRLVPSGDCPKL